MSQGKNDKLSDSQPTSIDRVLTAEEEGKKRITECRKQAARILEEARETVRRISHRADKRTTAIHRRCAETTATAIKALNEAEARKDEGPADPNLCRQGLDEAVRSLGKKLIGASDA